MQGSGIVARCPFRSVAEAGQIKISSNQSVHAFRGTPRASARPAVASGPRLALMVGIRWQTREDPPMGSYNSLGKEGGLGHRVQRTATAEMPWLVGRPPHPGRVQHETRKAALKRGATGSDSIMIALMPSGMTTRKTPPKKAQACSKPLDHCRERLLEAEPAEHVAAVAGGKDEPPTELPTLATQVEEQAIRQKSTCSSEPGSPSTTLTVCSWRPKPNSWTQKRCRVGAPNSSSVSCCSPPDRSRPLRSAASR